MRAVVLVGGFGTRLRPLTATRPKQMLPVVDRPMLEHVVGRLAEHGVDSVVLSLGYRPDAFAEAYPDGRCAGVDLHYAVEPEPLDTAGAIAFAARSAGLDETFIALNGDVLTDIDISRLVDLHNERGAEATIALTPVEDPSRFGVVPIDPQGRVEAFIEKPPAGTAPSNWINAGTYVLEPGTLDRIMPGRRVSIERDTFPALVADGSLYAMGFDDYWIDAGTPEAYLDANLDLVSGRRWAPDPFGDLAVAASAVVHPDATVRCSVIGPGVTVGPGASIVDSVVGSDSTIGSGASVTRSLIGVGTEVLARARVSGLSVVGDGQVVRGEVIGERIPEPQ
jgi:mannose-1-phosphate guanylyltransferase